MTSFHKKINRVIFFILFTLVFLFYLWSQLIGVTFFLLIILDFFFTKFIQKFLKNRLDQNFYQILKYSLLIVLPFVFAIFIRTFLFDIYFVPSSSMERTLFPNDYVLINKISYGTKIPKHMIDIPVIGSLFKKDNEPHIYDLYRSLKRFKDLKREDIVVFKSVTDNAKSLIKRIIGMPGDTLSIDNTTVKINNILLEDKPEYSYSYMDNTQNKMFLTQNYSNKEYNTLNLALKKNLEKNITQKPSWSFYIFPYSKQLEWTRDNYGPLIIPKKGMIITLNKDNLPIYDKLISQYENEKITLSDNEIYNYTFKNNYYFMMGDNRHASIDSRVFGFVPENYVQGKLIYKYSNN